jgi:crotonobetainyl-CoA:carnitine CoA-transferase CaiB-like acyl-CoA transferase
MGACSDIRILDLSRILAGPWCTQIFADLGADVIKVENPDGGDDTRRWGPPYVDGPDGTSASAYFLSANRGKRSICVDITQPEGQALLRELVAKSDVLVENFKVGGLAKYGLDYDSLRRINPRLIYCSITGFGQNGPYSGRPGYDFVVQGMGGLMSITGLPAEAGGGPTKAGVALADVVTGLYASIGILAALRHRDRTGEGQQIDIALLDTVVAMLANQGLNYLVSREDGVRLGNAHPSIVPYDSFSTSDDDITIAVGNDLQFRRLCKVLGLPELARDDRFTTNEARVHNRVALTELLGQALRQRPSAHWLAAMNDALIPAGPINSLAQVFADPQVQHRQLELKLHHDVIGDVPSVANPLRFSKTPITYDRAPPLAGEHTESVLRQILHMTTSEISRIDRSALLED